MKIKNTLARCITSVMAVLTILASGNLAFSKTVLVSLCRHLNKWFSQYVKITNQEELWFLIE